MKRFFKILNFYKKAAGVVPDAALKYIEEADPVIILNSYLELLGEEAKKENYYDFIYNEKEEIKEDLLEDLSKSIQSADLYLTGKESRTHNYYKDLSKKILEEGGEEWYLADGGYSRIYISIIEPPFLRFDYGLASSPNISAKFDNSLKKIKAIHF